MSQENVRYGRTDSGLPKNTLVTIESNDMVYFGISRCRAKDITDRLLRKSEGLKKARARAVGALKGKGFNKSLGNIQLHSSGLLGCVPVQDVGSLLEYFDNVDTECLRFKQS